MRFPSRFSALIVLFAISADVTAESGSVSVGSFALLENAERQKLQEDAGEQELKGTLDGIPMHYVSVPNFAHGDVIIEMDGVVDEDIWDEVPYFDNMLISVPGIGERGDYRTETRMFATEKGLYVSGVMYQPPETLARRLTNRDEFIDRDTFGVTLDTSGQGLFAYWFIVALGGSQQDGKVLPERRYSVDWDGPWHSATAEFDGGWTAEMYFPWSMMNIPQSPGARQIGFAISRQVSHMNQRYYWPGHAYSSPQFVTALNSMRVSGVDPRQQITVIPYASSTIDEARNDDETRAGVDVTWKPSTRAELTASIYPDFGAVEADNVVLNLTAFETFFPEKRLFFQEGNEIFVTTPRANNGYNPRMATNENFATTSRRIFVSDNVPPPVALLNTRRIGGTATQVDVPAGITVNRGEQDLPTDLLGAVKVTGAVNNIRYGVLGAFEDEVEWLGTDTIGNPVDIDHDGRDFGVVRVSYEQSEENRFAVGYLGTLVDGPIYDARVHGIDVHYGTGDGVWAADLQMLHSDVDGLGGKAGFLDVMYAANSSIQHKFELDYFDEDVDINDLGFLRRNDYAGLQYIFRYADTRHRGVMRGNRGSVVLRQQYNVSEGRVVDSGIYWRNILTLPGRNTLRTAFAYLPERYEDIDSRGGGTYRAEDRLWWDLIWTTDASKMFSWSIGAGAFKEDLGDWTQTAWVGVTFRPSDRFYMDVDVKYKRRDGWLVYQGADTSNPALPRAYFGAYNGIDWQPGIKLTWFLALNHQIRFTMQWAGVRMDEQGFYRVPDRPGELIRVAPVLPDHDFTVSLLTTQLRYRWEIAPLTDLFVVYNRGNKLPFRRDDEFTNLFEDTLDDPLIDSLVVKLRWRFGN